MCPIVRVPMRAFVPVLFLCPPCLRRRDHSVPAPVVPREGYPKEAPTRHARVVARVRAARLVPVVSPREERVRHIRGWMRMGMRVGLVMFVAGILTGAVCVRERRAVAEVALVAEGRALGCEGGGMRAGMWLRVRVRVRMRRAGRGWLLNRLVDMLWGSKRP